MYGIVFSIETSVGCCISLGKCSIWRGCRWASSVRHSIVCSVIRWSNFFPGLPRLPFCFHPIHPWERSRGWLLKLSIRSYRDHREIFYHTVIIIIGFFGTLSLFVSTVLLFLQRSRGIRTNVRWFHFLRYLRSKAFICRNYFLHFWELLTVWGWG